MTKLYKFALLIFVIVTSHEFGKEKFFNEAKSLLDNGKIEEVIYHGDHTRVRLNLLGNNEFILKVPNRSERMDIKLGNEISIGWNSQDSRALNPK